jgi:hypothetical protein
MSCSEAPQNVSCVTRTVPSWWCASQATVARNEHSSYTHAANEQAVEHPDANIKDI